MQTMLYKILAPLVVILVTLLLVWRLTSADKNQSYDLCLQNEFSTHLRLNWLVDSYSKALFHEGKTTPDSSKFEWESDWIWAIALPKKDAGCAVKVTIVNSNVTAKGYAESAENLAKELNGELEIQVNAEGALLAFDFIRRLL